MPRAPRSGQGWIEIDHEFRAFERQGDAVHQKRHVVIYDLHYGPAGAPSMAVLLWVEHAQLRPPGRRSCNSSHKEAAACSRSSWLRGSKSSGGTFRYSARTKPLSVFAGARGAPAIASIKVSFSLSVCGRTRTSRSRIGRT